MRGKIRLLGLFLLTAFVSNFAPGRTLSVFCETRNASKILDESAIGNDRFSERDTKNSDIANAANSEKSDESLALEWKYVKDLGHTDNSVVKLGDSGFATKMVLIGTGTAPVGTVAAVFGLKLLKTSKDEPSPVPAEHDSKPEEEDKKIDDKSNSVSTTSKVSSTQIILFSVLGVALAPIIILAITAFAKGSMGVRSLLLKFKLKWLWFALEALVAKYWFNHSNYKGQFSNIPTLYWYGNNCFINSAFYTFVAPENYELYKAISEDSVENVVSKINLAVKSEKWSKFKYAWNKLDEDGKKNEAKRIINIAKVCKNFLDMVDGKSKNDDYMMDDKFSLVGKFKSWQLNEEDGSYKAQEKKLLGQNGSELREDYNYGGSATVIERLGGYRFDFYSLNKNDSKAKEKKTSNSLQNDSSNENSLKAKKEELSNPQKSSCNKSEENDFGNNGGFEVLNEVDEVNIVASCIEAKLPPYFSILADALKDDKNNFSNDCYEIFGYVSYNLEDLKKLHTYKRKLLTSISSGKDGGAFTVQPKYRFSEVTKEYEPVSWLVLDCHGGPHKILNNLNELYNFLEVGKAVKRSLLLRYTGSKNFEQDNLTKKYYLDNSSIITE